MNGEFLIVM